MRRVRYSVAMSLDGYIAGPAGEHDWIIMDPTVDFASLFKEFDTVLIGRRTFDRMRQRGAAGGMPGMRNYVFSRSLRGEELSDVMIIGADALETVAALRTEPGKDIWLMGGGALFRSLHEAGLVDTIEAAVIPVLLGQGIPLLPPPARSVRLDFMEAKTYPSGIVALRYSVARNEGR
jgi:dihydrofolate reductase